MTGVNDGYDSYYAERLWQLLPAVYRTADTDDLNASGPLRELVNRIGTQLAVVRRSIDRLWADQSIETCDDWVIPYLGDLLGTNLVDQADPRGQRLEVANTIHYRRRKGTTALLEELAIDVTGWPARVVEGFRRLARTRHGLDPAVGPAAFPAADPATVAALLRVQGLTGLLTGGLAGGFADLRSPHGASLAGTAFDESFHTADFRAGAGALGHFGIPKLLVFLWRLTSFAVVAGTPVPVTGCANQYVFDPAGRRVPLFLSQPPLPDDSAPSWTFAPEWGVPGPLTSSLETALTDQGMVPPAPARPPYPSSGLPQRYALGGGAQFAGLWPEAGTFAVTGPPPAQPSPVTVSYHYGFSSLVGAGPYDRDKLADRPAVVGSETLVTGTGTLAAALADAGAVGTVTISDSLTRPECPAAGSTAEPVSDLLVRAGPGLRPVLRPLAGAGPWVFTGGGDGQLVLDGLTLCGCDLVLKGSFGTVRITACTIDPGTAAPGSPPLSTAVDGLVLGPGRIFVEDDPAAGQPGAIGQLIIDHAITGPVRTRFGGSVQTLTISDSIVQGLPATTGAAYTAADIFDPVLLAAGLLSR